jgi:hypothetical protein
MLVVVRLETAHSVLVLLCETAIVKDFVCHAFRRKAFWDRRPALFGRSGGEGFKKRLASAAAMPQGALYMASHRLRCSRPLAVELGRRRIWTAVPTQADAIHASRSAPCWPRLGRDLPQEAGSDPMMEFGP